MLCWCVIRRIQAVMPVSVPNSSGPRRNAAGRRGGTAAGRVVAVFGAGDQDAFDGAIRRVADGDGAGAGGLQPLAAVFVAQPDHPLGRAQVMDGVIGHEFGDHRLQAGPTSSAVRRHQIRVRIAKRDLLRRVVGEVGGPPARTAHVGGHHVGAGEDLHDVSGGAGMQALPDQPPRHASRAPCRP